MTQAEIIAMATESGLNSYRIAPGEAVAVWGRFAALVAAKERDACALLCDRMAQDAALSNRRRCDADALARSIRARGTKEGV